MMWVVSEATRARSAGERPTLGAWMSPSSTTILDRVSAGTSPRTRNAWNSGRSNSLLMRASGGVPRLARTTQNTRATRVQRRSCSKTTDPM